MKTILRRFIVVVLVFVGGMSLVARNVFGAEMEKIAVTISPIVQEQIKKNNLRERKRIEAAISSGNRFIPRFFDGSTNNITDELSIKEWNRNIRPLVNKNAVKWSEMTDEKGSGLELEIAGKASTFVGVCPQVELTSIQDEAGLINLRYRVRVIGVSQREKGFSRMRGALLIDEHKDFQEALVGLDRNYKVDFVAPKYLGLFVTSDFFIEGYNTVIEFQEHRLVGTSPDEQARATEEIEKHKEWIKLINEQEAAICNAN